jgi:uncharacterized phage protein gp47/JayE
MPFSTPTLGDLITRIATDIDSNLEGTDSTLRRANTAVIGRASAGLAFGQYGYLGWIALQIFITSCDTDELVIAGAEYGLTQNPATFSYGPITVAGNNGMVIPAGTSWQRSDGEEYTSTADVPIVNGTATVSIIDTTAGSLGNCAAGTTLDLLNTIEGVAGTAVVAAPGLCYGANIEDIEVFRARVLAYKRQKPAGGNQNDYATWAEQVTGVLRAWTIPLDQGPGTVAVVIVADSTITRSEMPTNDLLAAVRAYIVAICPEDVKYLRVLPWIPAPLNLTIKLTPNTVAVQTNVIAELTDLVAREGENAGSIPLSHINEAIALADGETDETVTVPAGDFVYTAYERVVMGTVTWL